MVSLFKLIEKAGIVEEKQGLLIQKKDKVVFLNQFFGSNSFVPKSLSNLFGLAYLSGYKILKSFGLLVSTRFFYFLFRTGALSTVLENRVLLGKLMQRRIFRKFRKENKFSGYRFIRRLQGYAIRGQRTHSNHKMSKKKIWAFWLARK
jgi:ribosomal protein S13